MEEKFNEPTPQRPEGPRLIDAPMVNIDLNAFMDQITGESSWKDSDRNAITVFKTAGMRMVLMAMHAGAEMDKHTAEGVISVQVLRGRIQFATDDQQTTLGQGQLVTLHRGIPHSVSAEEESIFLLTIAG